MAASNRHLSVLFCLKKIVLGSSYLFFGDGSGLVFACKKKKRQKCKWTSAILRVNCFGFGTRLGIDAELHGIVYFRLA